MRLKNMLALLRERGYQSVSLSVQRANYAVKIYRDAGFSIREDKKSAGIQVRFLGGMGL